ncbi:Aste57867_23996 [Aphanomyces stellatus]|uniref:Aste57867_23996 protein n=1 Tax=Aphanomyces stellatus TaxID=120398 RepID=A0A485LQU4_9STRA|nr:hypothetical protein As57867_023923 [Aphanomyces stellatus]VFU00639.1 Aste57867_23996 [Aphanomyces stellatus]
MTLTTAPCRDARSAKLTQSDAHKIETMQALHKVKWCASATTASLFEGYVLKAGPTKIGQHVRAAAPATTTASSAARDKRAKSDRFNASLLAHDMLCYLLACGTVKMENLTTLDAEIDAIMALHSGASPACGN